ncbi:MULTISPECIES: DNA primase [Spongiibacter]|uniref:DNA primase n=1 Tax=Spongiibacter TaxID=630749 RepID=UPI000C6BBBD4|nr:MULTISPECIES: DNA primase [Spongiibacter]MAY38326.1 DNA primase [Spongiibacter sp.]MBI56860.1 DNA primase [Spongiibacter sp.]
MAAKGRIPQAFIDDLLSRVDIVDVINRRVSLKKTGRNYTARCPFHEEKTPSFSVNPDKQFYYCFGCGAAGNAIGFIMDYERQDFPAAIDSLAHSAGLEVPREELSPQQAQKQQRRKTVYDLMEQLASYYQRQLRQHPDAERAVGYLKKRGLSGQIARDFGIGFAPPGWDNILQGFGANPEGRQQLLDAGMLVEKEDSDRLYDRFRDRIMFPIHDNRGRVVAFGGRVLGDDKPKYLNSPETDIFHKGRELYGLYEARQHNRQLERVIIVEGYMDVVALAQHGIRCAVATLGTASNSDHLRTAFRYCSEIVFCFDGDEAGRRAAQRALENALPTMEDGRSIRFLFLDEGQDPDDTVRRIGGPGFEGLVARSAKLESYFFDSFNDQLDPDTMEGRAKLAKLATPLLMLLPDGVYKELMFDELAKRSGLSRPSLDKLRENTPQPEQQEERADSPAPRPKKRDSATLLEQLPRGKRDPGLFALAMLLYAPSEIVDGISALPPSDNDPGLQLLSAIVELLRKRPESSTAMLLGHWHGQPEYPLLTDALKTIELLGSSLDEALARRAFFDTLEHFERRQKDTHLQQRLAALREREEVDKAATGNYAELSDDTKAELRHIQQLLAHKHRK